jgi:hypothetical protein
MKAAWRSGNGSGLLEAACREILGRREVPQRFHGIFLLLELMKIIWKKECYDDEETY